MNYRSAPLLAGLALHARLGLAAMLLLPLTFDRVYGQSLRTPRVAETKASKSSPQARPSREPGPSPDRGPVAGLRRAVPVNANWDFPSVRNSPQRSAATAANSLSRTMSSETRVARTAGSVRRADFDELDSLKQATPPASQPVESLPMDLVEPGATEVLSPDSYELGVGEEWVMDGYVPSGRVGAGSRLYGSGEVMSWWTKGMDVPALVTAGGATRDNIGVLGTPGVTVIFGNEAINTDPRVGGRFVLGYHLPRMCGTSFEAGYLFMGEASTDFQASSANQPTLGRPFNNTTTGLADAVQLSVPGELQGRISVQSSTEFQALDLRFRSILAEGPDMSVAMLLGYRHAEMDDDLTITDSLTTLVAFPPPAPVVPAATNLSGIDQFQAMNSFDGAQVGFTCELARGPWTWEFLLNLALGNTSSEVVINGSTTTTVPPGAPVNQVGSKLALPSNMGRYQQDHFSFMPELGLRLNYELGPRWNLSVAYTLIYWSQVARAGNQIDLSIDENQFPAPNIPAGQGLWPQFPFALDDFWAQAVGLRLEHRF